MVERSIKATALTIVKVHNVNLVFVLPQQRLSANNYGVYKTKDWEVPYIYYLAA